MHRHTCIDLHTQTRMHMQTHTHARMYARTHTHMHEDTHMEACTQAHARNACAHVIGVAAGCMRAGAPHARVLRVIAARRYTHRPASADNASKAPAGIAVIWLPSRNLRARDVATRHRRRRVSVRGGGAWTGVSEPAGIVHASRRAASSLVRCCSVALRARARQCRCDGARGHDARRIDRRADTYMQQQRVACARRMRACDWCSPSDACAHARRMRVACACGASAYAQPS